MHQVDVRFLKNPHYDQELRPLTGLDEAVGKAVQADPDFEAFESHLIGLLRPLLPRYRAEGKRY
ncbi:MAG: RNase adapter RapZ, partial [Myxococcota bacterium]